MTASAGQALHEEKDSGKTVEEKVEQNVDEVKSTPAFRRFARAGIGARAMIYLVVAYICAQIAAMHRSPSQASGTGALAEVARQPGGRPVLALLALGLLAYSAWKVSQVLGDHEQKSPLRRLGRAFVVLIYLGLCTQAIELVVSAKSPQQASNGASGHPQPLVASVLHWPGGPGWVGLAGTILLAAGVAMITWAVVHDYRASFPRLEGAASTWVRLLGGAGDGIRGVLACLLSAYVFEAAVDNDPSQAKSLTQALLSFSSSTWGTAVLGAVTAGLAAYFAYSLLEAFYGEI